MAPPAPIWRHIRQWMRRGSRIVFLESYLYRRSLPVSAFHPQVLLAKHSTFWAWSVKVRASANSERIPMWGFWDLLFWNIEKARADLPWTTAFNHEELSDFSPVSQARHAFTDDPTRIQLDRHTLDPLHSRCDHNISRCESMQSDIRISLQYQNEAALAAAKTTGVALETIRTGFTKFL